MICHKGHEAKKKGGNHHSYRQAATATVTAVFLALVMTSAPCLATEYSAIYGMMLATEMTVAVARAVPPPEPLERALAGADLVVVGKLGKLAPVEGTRQATGVIAVTQTLKGPAEMKTVTLLTAAPGQQGDPRSVPVVGAVIHREGDEGIWILKKHVAEGGKVRCSDLRPMTALDEVKRILKEQGMLTQPSDAPQKTAVAQPPVGRVVGWAVDYTGDPVADAAICAFPHDHPSQKVLGRAAADGMFSIEVAPCTNLIVEVMTAGNWQGGKVCPVTVLAGRETNVGRIAVREIPGHHPPEDPQ